MKQYRVDYSEDAQKSIDKLDSPIRKRITEWVDKNLDGCENPRYRGKPLRGNLRGNWRYRVGDYRLIAKIEDDKILITVVDVDHRRQIYK